MNARNRRQGEWTVRALGILAAALVAASAGAATWDGGGDGANWFDGSNWDPDGVPGGGATVAIGTGATILLTNETAELASFTMTGGTLTFSNWTTRLRATEVVVTNNAILTLPVAFINNAMSNHVWVVCSNFTLGASAKIDADGRGYARENGPGAPLLGVCGGSYGGRGAGGETGWSVRRSTYGSASEPTGPGSGGTGGATAAGSGGGAIRIQATGHVAIHGTLTANGNGGSLAGASGGSGGAIWVSCLTYSGSSTGLLSVRGGNGHTRGGPGGGGRIAVVYDSAAQAALSPVNPGVRFNASAATAGRQVPVAEAGTVYFPDRAMLSDQMTAQWQGGNLHIPGFAEWSLTGSLEINGVFGLPTVTNLTVVNDLTITSGGNISLYSAPTNASYRPYGMTLNVGGELAVENNGRLVLASHMTNGAIPWVTCDKLRVDAGGTIDADYKGYGPPGESPYTGPGGGTAGTYGEGGSHGGRGSIGRDKSFTLTKAFYGDPLWPVTPGSAGGGTDKGSHGGGVIAIICDDTATIHGTLTADGYSSLISHGGTGAGGSILVACTTFHGSASGLLRARGGMSVYNSGGGGGGGRIAVIYDPEEQALLPQPNPGVAFNATTVATVPIGNNPHLAERGTLYLPDAKTLFLSSHMSSQWQDADLVIPGGMTNWLLPSLQLDGKFNIPGLVTMSVAGNLTMTSGALLSLYSHPSNAVSEEIGVRLKVGGTLTLQGGAKILLVCDLETGASPYIECGCLVLQEGATINADYWGFDMETGPGRGKYYAGGGYGGAGSRGNGVAGNAGQPYAREFAPIYAGSGGGKFSDTGGGGRGGGAVRIGARGAMTIDGTVSANGMYRFVIHAGSGSGGGILLTAQSFEGSGVMQANGGNTSNYGGAGGGGRICVWTPFLTPEYLRELVDRDLPGSAVVLDHASRWPDLVLSVAHGTGGTNPDLAEDGTIFFGRLVMGTLFMIR